MMKREGQRPTTYHFTSSVSRAPHRNLLSVLAYGLLSELRLSTGPLSRAAVWWEFWQARTWTGTHGSTEIQVRCPHATVLQVQQGRTRERRIFVACIPWSPNCVPQGRDNQRQPYIDHWTELEVKWKSRDIVPNSHYVVKGQMPILHKNFQLLIRW